MQSQIPIGGLRDTTMEDQNNSIGELIYNTIDPLDPRKVSFDIFEVYCHEMLTTNYVGRRAYLIGQMRYMITRLIGQQMDYGRLYNRTCMANIVSRITGRYPYEVPEEEMEEGDQAYQMEGCLVDFTPDKWQKCICMFENLREGMVRNDAALIVLPSQFVNTDDRQRDDSDIPDADDNVNEAVNKHVDFQKGYKKLMDLMKFHACLSHLQPHFEKAIQKGSAEGVESVVIPHDNIVAFDSAIEEHFEDDEDSKYARILNDLLEVNKKMNRSSRYGGLHLKSFQEIKKIYESNSRIFDLESFQHKFIQLMRRWTDIVLPTPTLSKLAYGASKKKDDEGAAASSPNATKAAEANDKENVKSSQEDEVPPPRTGRGKRAKHREDRKPPPPDIDTIIEENEVNDEIESSSSSDGDAYEEDGKMDAREALKRKREAFVKKIKDPMKDIVAAAEGARGGPKEEEESEDNDDDEGDNSSDDGIAKRRKGKTPSFRKQKKSAHQLNFTDSDDDSSEEEEEEEEGGVALSKLPTKYKAKQEKKKPTKIHITRKNDTTKKRKRFTEEEDGAIRLGVERFGAGNWSQIKAYYSMELIDRTTINLKDRWRTLNK